MANVNKKIVNIANNKIIGYNILKEVVMTFMGLDFDDKGEARIWC